MGDRLGAAYATWWVRQAMPQLIAELTRPLVLSDRAARQLARVKNARRRALAEGGREPSRNELAARAELPARQVDTLLAVDRMPRSTDEALNSDDGTICAFGELLADPRAEDEYERTRRAILAQDLPALLAQLPDREQAILRARYGLDGEEQPLRQIGARLGLSAERVRQLEQRALDKQAAAAGADGPGW